MRIRWQFLTLPVLAGALFGTLRPPAPPLASARITHLVVLKSQHTLQLWNGDQLLRSYQVALGPHPSGPKQQEGDGRTPEGLYTITGHNPRSVFHLSLRISYPSPEDIARASRQGVAPGGDIMIHGLPNGWGWVGSAHRKKDWTAGCIAVTNSEIEEIYRLVPDGTPIEIRP